jgi:hypothetical protein
MRTNKKDYEEIFDNKLKSIDNNSKLFLFKALKSKNKSEFYLKYPDFEIRRLICKFRLRKLSIGYLPNSYLAEKLLEHFLIPRINLQNLLCILS